MKKFLIKGSSPLSGCIRVSGSKNAALPIIFATLITKGVSKIKNLPDIGDVEVALELIAGFGAGVLREGNAVYIDTQKLNYISPPTELISKIRASTYLIGASLSRFGKSQIFKFGGCNFSKRPIDMHLYAASRLGAELSQDMICAKELKGATIEFDKPSVGATVNAIIMAASAKGETLIRGHAKEPHVMALVEYLILAGADITINEEEIRIKGRELHGASVCVIGDMIEAGTYLTAGLITGGGVCVGGVAEESISPYLDLVSSMGAEVFYSEDGILVSADTPLSYGDVTAAPYPEFPTDLQPIVAPLFARWRGGRIEDRVWQGRFGYLSSLYSFGVRYKIDGNSARIEASHIKGANTACPDLRGGMSCVLAALSAEGESVISSAETVLRGYEEPIKKFRALGAELEMLG